MNMERIGEINVYKLRSFCFFECFCYLRDRIGKEYRRGIEFI